MRQRRVLNNTVWSLPKEAAFLHNGDYGNLL